MAVTNLAQLKRSISKRRAIYYSVKSILCNIIVSAYNIYFFICQFKYELLLLSSYFRSGFLILTLVSS